MTWQTEMVPLVRSLINDLNSVLYTNGNIEDFIVYAAHFVNKEVSFSNTYSIDLALKTISPDPTTPTREDGFINLVSIKAAIFILLGELKVASSNAVKVTDGPSSIDYTSVYKAKKELLDWMIKNYEQMKMSLILGDLNAGEAIMTPFTQEDVGGEYYR